MAKFVDSQAIADIYEDTGWVEVSTFFQKSSGDHRYVREVWYQPSNSSDSVKQDVSRIQSWNTYFGVTIECRDGNYFKFSSRIDSSG